MRLGTIELDGDTRAAVWNGDGWIALPAADVGELAAMEGWHTLAQAALSSPTRVLVTEPRLVRPVRHPSQIFCCGLNYRDHIAETGRDTPTDPTLFAKFAPALTDPDAEIVIAGSEKVDWEAELAVVIGREVHDADEGAARDAILGYTVANDVSARDWQSRTLQWLAGKTFWRSTPIGPVVVTPDEFDPVAGAAIGADVAGERMQSSNTRHLLFDAAHLVSYISRFTHLLPGDLVLTGTPGGVGLGRTPQRFLADGEEVDVWIEGIGHLRNRFRILPAAVTA